VLRIRAKSTSEGAEIEGDQVGFEELEALILAGSGTIALSRDGDLGSYSRWLNAIRVTTSPDDRVHIAYTADDNELNIGCPPATLETLAWNLAGFMADESPGSHRHEEFYPDHFYLDQASVPLVVMRLAN
jgi:hypothetical protein